MTKPSAPSEFLVISRGRWDRDATPERIQAAIDRFYAWHDGQVAAGRMKAGQRLKREGRLASRAGITDGPYAEAKEVIGGYWFVYADSLDDAARILADNPCIALGLEMEIRPIEPERASAYARSTETPDAV